MKNKNILSLLVLSFTSLMCMTDEKNIRCSYALPTQLEALKKLSMLVWDEMQRQPDSFVAGVGLGTVLNACYAQHPIRTSIIPHVATGIGIYGLYKKQSKTSPLFTITSQKSTPLVCHTATAANIVTGAVTAYAALSVINVLFRP